MLKSIEFKNHWKPSRMRSNKNTNEVLLIDTHLLKEQIEIFV